MLFVIENKDTRSVPCLESWGSSSGTDLLDVDYE